MKLLFYTWNTIIILVSAYIVIAYWPDYTDNEFPLYTDLFTLLVVIPSFYLLCVGIPSQLFIVFIRRPLTRFALILVHFIIVMFVVISLFPFHLKTILLVSIYSLIFLFLYLAISYSLYFHSSSTNNE